MRTWRVAHAALRCGNCRATIAAGSPYLEYQIGAARLWRCQACGENMTGAPAPEVLEDEPREPGMEGVRYQPSLKACP